MNPSLSSSIMMFPTSQQSSPNNILMSTDTAGVDVDDFIIQKVIGRGSFGKVYMVKKKSDG